MSKLTHQEKPEWFKGEWYTKGDTVTSLQTGEKVELTGPELSIYDLIIGSRMYLQSIFDADDPIALEFDEVIKKGLDWFRKANPSAYNILFDNI